MKNRRRLRGRYEGEAASEDTATSTATGTGMVDLVSHFGRHADETEPFDEWLELPAYRPSFGALLVRSGIASDGDVKAALAEGMQTGERLGEVVIRKGWATEDRIAQLLAEQWQLPYVEAANAAVDSGALQRVPLALARELRALPIGLDSGTVVLAVAEPTDELFAEVKSRVGDASFVVVARSVLEPLLETLDAPKTAAPPPEPTVPDYVEPAFAEREEEPSPAPQVSEYDVLPTKPEPESHPEPEPVDRHDDEPATHTTVAPVDVGDVADLSESMEAAVRAFERMRKQVEMLGESLAATRGRLAERESALAAAAEARERDGATIRRLEAELAQRDGLFDTLKGQLATLTRTLGEGSG